MGKETTTVQNTTLGLHLNFAFFDYTNVGSIYNIKLFGRSVFTRIGSNWRLF